VLVAAAVVPTPPLLIPEVAAGSAARDTDLRTAAVASVGQVLGAGADQVVVVGEAPATGPLSGEPDWHPFGLRLPRPEQRLPLAHGVGAWLLGQAGCMLQIEHVGVAADTTPQGCAALGRALTAGRRTALLACGDGTARRDEKAPGHFSPAAAGFDERVDAALRAGDPAGLLALDAEEAAELWVAGRPAWQVLAGAAEGCSWDAEVTYAAEPYGVHYVVATWLPREDWSSGGSLGDRLGPFA
jgi:hypothetical protein